MPHVLPRATRIPSVSVTALGHVCVQGQCCCHHHADLSGLCCHPGPWWHLGLSCCLGPHLGPWPSCSQIWVYACDSCYHQGLCQSLESEQPSKTMLVSEGHTANGAILIWVTCIATGAMVMPMAELPPRAMDLFSHCNCCLWWCSCPVLLWGLIGTMAVEIQESYWVVSVFHWSWGSGPCLNTEQCIRITLSPLLRRDGLNPHKGMEKLALMACA